MIGARLVALLGIGLTLRFAVSAWNGFWGPSFGAELDAAAFHAQASAYAAAHLELNSFRIGWIYAYLLGAFYAVVTHSLFLGSLLSCLAWLLSAFVLNKTMRLIGMAEEQRLYALLIYVMLPSSILNTAVTLREAYELLFVNLATYSVLKIHSQPSPRHWCALAGSVAAMSVLHGALFAFGASTIVAAIVLRLSRKRTGISIGRALAAASFATLVICAGVFLFAQLAYDLSSGILVALQAHQEGAIGIEARANYRSELEISSTIDLLLFLPVALAQYLFEPTPWRALASVDLALMLENLLRGWLMWRSWIMLRAAEPSVRTPLFFLFTAYWVLETIWSIGTVNWGTAARHHLPALGLLAISAFASAPKMQAAYRSTSREAAA